MYPGERLTKESQGSTPKDQAASNGDAQSVRDACREVAAQLVTPERRSFQFWRTGFKPLDEVIGGGIREGALVLLAGMPSVGKTTIARQMARNVARVGDAVALYVGFEHQVGDLLTRLIALEGGLATGKIPEPLSQNDARRLLGTPQKRGQTSLKALGQLDSRLAAAIARVEYYRDRRYLADASTRATTVRRIDRLVDAIQQSTGLAVVLFVDYLQKVRTTKRTKLARRRSSKS